MTKIVLDNVTKSFIGRTVLKDISFTIESGDFAALLGPVNAGKTTLLRLIAGTLKPDKGRIYFDDKDVTDLPPQKRNVGMVFQIFALYPNMTVYENIASPLKIKNLPEKEIKTRVMELAKMLKIADLLEKWPNELSGGEAQRVVIARALVKDPGVYLLDEPLTNLDYKLRESMRIELKKMLTLKPGTIIYSTSQPEEAAALANTLIFLYNGQVVQTGPVKECFENPVNVTAAKNYSVPPMNIMEAIPVEKDGKKFLQVPKILELDVTQLSLPEEDKYFIGIYPYHMYLEKHSEDMIAIPVELELQELAGSEMTLLLKSGEYTLQAYLPFARRLDPEKVKRMYINPENIYIFSGKTERLIQRYGKREVK